MMERRSLRGSTRERGYISRHYVWAESSCLRTGLHALTQVGQRRQLLANVWNEERRFKGNAVCVMGCVQDSWWCVSSQLQSAEWKERLLKRIKTRGSLRTRANLRLPCASTAVHKKISTWIAYVSSGCTVFFLFLVPLICLDWGSVKARTFSFSAMVAAFPAR